MFYFEVTWICEWNGLGVAKIKYYIRYGNEQVSLRTNNNNSTVF